MAGNKVKWTDQQFKAINARDRDVLVTASAGTGKTAVLSARCVDILKSDGCDVFDMLVLTFTELAAEEMRSRIGEQLRKAYLESGDRRLRGQLVLLQGADISTVHSFCKKIAGEYFYRVDLDPAFGIVEADQQKLIKAEVLEKTVEWAWQQENLRMGMESLLKGRDLRIDKGFLANIIDISEFLDTLVSRDKWYDLLGADSSAADEQKRIIGKKLDRINQQLLYAQRLCCDQGCDSDWLEKFKEKFIEPAENLKKIFEAGRWEDFSAVLREFAWNKKMSLKGVDGSACDVYNSLIDSAKKNFNNICSLSVLNPDYVRAVGSSANLQIKVVAELVKKFDDLYKKAKRAINCLDFADLEYYALRILTVEKDGLLVPSEVALGLREKYKHIFVDEYQDINPVQQAILDSVSKGGNVFVVGDVKQSIYAFRGAEPGIFLERLNNAADGKTGGIKIDLNANFRSKQNILEFVNTIFEKIMSGSLCGLDYDSSARLSAGTDEQKNSMTPAIELHILDEQPSQKDENQTDAEETEFQAADDWAAFTPAKRQAAMIARRIKQMIGAESGSAEFEIFDKACGKYRPVEYRDIVILMRSPAGKAEDYVEVLRLAGVPVSSQTGGGYFQATEISDCLCLLKVLDNRQRDIELAAVLRSPLFKLTDSCLAKIKALCPADDGPMGFYGMVRLYCDKGLDEKLKDRLNTIMDQLDSWSTLARSDSLAGLIWQIYRKTGYLSFVSALPGGQGRRANLLKLHDMAIQFAKFNGKSRSGSLTRFVEFVEKVQDAEHNWSTAKPESQAENNVQIMSVHGSKGLEFGVVFLAELNTKFNTSDSNGQVLVNADDTIGLKVIDADSRNKLSSITHQVIAEKKAKMSLAEELRVLYVALTRAREKLILTASAKVNKCAEIVNKGTYFKDRIADWAIGDCKQPLDWILYGLSEQPRLQQAFGVQPATKVEKGLVDVTIYNDDELEKLSQYLQRLKDSKAAGGESKKNRSNEQLLARVKESLDWRYVFDGASKIRAKDSVTQMTHRADEFAKIDHDDALAIEPKALGGVAGAGSVDIASIGTGTHLLIASLNLKKQIDAAVVEKVKQELIAAGRLSQDIAGRIDVGAIVGFFQSQLGQKVLAAKRLWQEWQFTFGLDPANSLANDNQIIVVQGVIDLLAETDDGFLVIDFKTDRVSADQAKSRVERYRGQVELYGKAVGAVMSTAKTADKWVYFLHAGCGLKI